MTETGQRQMIATSALIVLLVGFITAIQKGRSIPTSRFIIGYGFAFLITSILADMGVSFGAALALIIMVGTVLENADSVLSWVDDRSAGKHGVTPRKNVKRGTRTVVNAASHTVPGE